jgi:hypothetical protein
MANQHTSIWNEETHAHLLSLREDFDLDWPDICEELGLPRDSSAPRTKYRRIVADAPYYESLRAAVDSSEGEVKAEESVKAEEDDSVEWEVESRVVKRKYEYDEERGEFTFVVRDGIFRISADSWRKVMEWYSAEGADLTMYEVASKLGISRPDLEACLKAYGHYKARPPVLREELAEASDTEEETLVDRAIEVRERQFSQKLQTRSREALKREVIKLRQELHTRGEIKSDVKDLIAELTADMGGFAGPVEKLVPRAGRIFDIHAPTFDAHIGLAAFKAQGYTNDYNSDIALTYIRTHGSMTAQRIAERVARGWKCRTAYMSHGGDTFHAPFGRTEHGRHLQRDKPDRILFHLGVRAFIDQIESVRPHAERVVVLGVEGNHGHLLDVLLVDFLKVYYKDCPDVVVEDSLSKRAFFKAGNALHVLDHGTTFNSVGTEASLSRADRITRIISGQQYHGTQRVYFYVGHMHHREEKSQAHMNLIRVPTMCHENDYEEFLGFYNDPQMDLYILDEFGRIEATERLYMADYVEGVVSRLEAA